MCVCVFDLYQREGLRWEMKMITNSALLDIWFYSNFSFNFLFSFLLLIHSPFSICFFFFHFNTSSALFHFISLLCALKFSHFPQNQLFLPFSDFSFFNIHFRHHLPLSYNFIAFLLYFTYIQLLFFFTKRLYFSFISLCL